VCLALALFLAGIASLFKKRQIQLALLIGAIVLIVPGSWRSSTQGWA
jgi:hypothetical protein